METRRLKELMAQCGMPNSQSVMQALQQAFTEGHQVGVTLGVSGMRDFTVHALATCKNMSPEISELAITVVNEVKPVFWCNSVVNPEVNASNHIPAPAPGNINDSGPVQLSMGMRKAEALRTGFNHRVANKNVNPFNISTDPELFEHWQSGWKVANRKLTGVD